MRIEVERVPSGSMSCCASWRMDNGCFVEVSKAWSGLLVPADHAAAVRAMQDFVAELRGEKA